MRTMTQQLITVISLGLLTLTSPAYATEVEPTNTKPKLPDGARLCPPIDQLSKDPRTQTWNTKDGWKSFDKSFADQITDFIGAQWQGVNVGNVVCLYQASDDMAFPIALEYGTLTYQPSGGAWSKNLGGYENCKSKKRKDCYFTPQAQAKETDIDQEAQSLKNDSGGQSEEGF